MTCLVCEHGVGDSTDGWLRIQITEVGSLETELQIPNGGIDAKLCGDCWRWVRSIAADPEGLLAAEALPPLAEAETND